VQKIAPVDVEPVSHYAENVTPIGKIEWRKRAQVQGRVTSIKAAPRGSAPVLEVEIWDETGGVSLQFLGRREIAGLEVGSQLRAEGMVGEEEGSMVILNPSYELLVQQVCDRLSANHLTLLLHDELQQFLHVQLDRYEVLFHYDRSQ